jgi:hypothetical protein
MLRDSLPIAPPTPGRPFEHWPTNDFDPRYGYAWWCGSGIVVTHITVSHSSEVTVRAYLDFESDILRKYADELDQSGGLFVIHDWREVKSYDSIARRTWQKRMNERPKGYLRGSVVCVVKAAPLLRMAVQSANVVASLTHNAKVELTTDIEGALRAHGMPRPVITDKACK